MDARVSYYDVLEISPFSGQHEITQAYERARATYSGDNPAIYTMFSQQEARELLVLVEEAYSVLGNKTLRALYDEKINSNVRGTEFSESPNVKKVVNTSPEALRVESQMIPLPSQKKTPPFKAQFEVKPEMETWIKSNRDWSGEGLKKVREYKNITLEKLSEITRITAFYANAVESMTPEHLPAAVFVRGYVAQIAKMLGLDEKLVADSYMKSFRLRTGAK